MYTRNSICCLKWFQILISVLWGPASLGKKAPFHVQGICNAQLWKVTEVTDEILAYAFTMVNAF